MYMCMYGVVYIGGVGSTEVIKIMFPPDLIVSDQLHT